MDSCSHCGGSLPADATFCPSCGRRTDAPAADVREVPIDVQHAEPRYFGLGTPVVVLSVAAVLLVVGIVLAATGYLVAGIVAIVVAFCLLPAFLAGARRWPDTSIAKLGVSTADRVRDEAGFAVGSGVALHQLVNQRELPRRDAYAVAAQVPDEVAVGENCVIMDNQSISLDVTIGNDVVMGSSNHIGDLTRIDDHCWISSHATVAADVKIRERAFIGIAATVSGRVTIGRESFIGANVLVSSDVPERAVRVAGRGEVDWMTSNAFMRVMIASGKL